VGEGGQDIHSWRKRGEGCCGGFERRNESITLVFFKKRGKKKGKEVDRRCKKKKQRETECVHGIVPKLKKVKKEHGQGHKNKKKKKKTSEFLQLR